MRNWLVLLERSLKRGQHRSRNYFLLTFGNLSKEKGRSQGQNSSQGNRIQFLKLSTDFLLKCQQIL